MKKIKESNGTHKGEMIYCPVNSWNCPYCGENNICHINDPIKDCDYFACFFESWEQWEAL